MTFVLYGLVPGSAPEINPTELKSMLDKRFGGSGRYSSRFVTLPFSTVKSVRIEWDGWAAVLTYKQGLVARDDAQEIEKRLASGASVGLGSFDRLIHVSFADDTLAKHTDEAVEVMRFLELIDGALVFDPQKNKLLNSPPPRQ